MKTKKATISEFIKKYPATIEAIVGILAITFLIYKLRSMLLFRESTLAHDNLLWNYPVFHFFAENIINGSFPFWNPFSHGGEPFYPIIGQMRLMEPITLLIIYIGKFLTNDIVTLFNWNRFIQSLVMAFGVYIVFRPIAAHLFIRLSLIPILLFSSFMLGSFRQDAILNQFLWIPFITYFLLHIIYYKDYRWHNWLILAGVIGLNWQSYFFTGTWIFLLFFFLGIVFFNRNLLSNLFKDKMIIFKVTVMSVIIFAMAMPNIALMLEKNRYIFPARMVDISKMQTPEGGPLQYEAASSTVVDSINMPYNLIAFTGTFSNIWDFIQIIAPDGNKHIGWPNREKWGKPSEAYMYIGFLPWAIAILGIVVGRHDLKRVWLLIFIAFGLLMIGPPGGLHRLLYYTYPPIWFVRHTHTFVLFFIFAFLYFYVLGFNHLFSTWGSQLFSSNSSKGIIGSLIYNNRMSSFKKVVDAIQKRKDQCVFKLQTENNEKDIFRLQGEIKTFESVVELPELREIGLDIFESSRVIVIFFLCVFFTMTVYWLTRIIYPETNYMFGILAIIFVAFWLLRKDLGKDGLFIVLIASHIALVFIFSTNTLKFARYIILVLGIPFILFMFIKSRIISSKILLRYSPVVLLFVFSVALTSDLVYSFQKSSFLYEDTKHPAITRNIETTVQKPFFPQKRFIYPQEYVASTDDEKGMRYLSLIYRHPFVFSSIMESDYSGAYFEPKGNFSALTNGSFEDWFITPDNKSVPEQFVYRKDGSGGGIGKYTGYDGIKHGKASVLLKPSSVGNSYIRYKTSDIDEIRGQYIRISLLAKSRNSFPGAIQIDLQVDGKSPIFRYYNNSGDWEKLTMVKYIDENTEDIAVTCNIQSVATAPVYLDGLAIEIVDVNTDTFEYALKAKRWSSFLLSKKYFELINMDIAPSILEEMFAVDKPMFQFKQGIAQVKENEIPFFLRQLGDAKSVELLQKFVIFDEQIESPLSKLGMLPEEYKKAMSARKNDSGIALDIKAEGNFTYTIDRYEYNSFDMQVSTDEEGILYWADGYDKNWHAYVNGKEVPIYRANVNFKAIGLPKGNNNISFVYNSYLFKMSLFIFYGTMISILALLIVRSFYVIIHHKNY